MGARMSHLPINFKDKLSLVSEHWSPKVIAEMNGYHFKVVKIQGEFIWHDHKDTDEVFIVLDGAMRIYLTDGHVDLSAGEMYVVPRGTKHKPFAEKEAQVLLIEPKGVVNTGEEESSLKANEVWL